MLEYTLVAACIIIMLGLWIDVRLSLWRKFVFVFFCILQLIIYYYLDILVIKFLKDLFWYSLILNISFIWHVLILNWGFNICKIYNLEYGMFFFSRLSIVTSLTIVMFLLRFLYFILDNIACYVTCWQKPEYYDKWGKFFAKHLNIIYILQIILGLCLQIIYYFQKVFENYSRLLLGKMDNSWSILKQPWYFYVMFIVVFTISILLWIPRIYMVWVILSIWWIYAKYKEYLEKPVYYIYKGLTRIQILIVFDSFYNNFEYRCNYPGFMDDYTIFIEQWNYIGGLIFNIYDFLYIFKYCHNYSLNLYKLQFGILQDGNAIPSEEIANEFLNKYQISMSSADFLSFVYMDLKFPDDYSAYLRIKDRSKIGLWEFVLWKRRLKFIDIYYVNKT